MPDKEDSLQMLIEKSATLLELHKELFAKAGCLFFKTVGTPDRVNKEFKIKDSQYKFDRERLKTFVTLYNEKVATIIRNAKYGTSSGGTATSPSSNLSTEEQYILGLLENNPTDANRILTMACVGHSISEIKELLVSLSKPTRTKVAHIIKFDLALLNK